MTFDIIVFSVWAIVGIINLINQIVGNKMDYTEYWLTYICLMVNLFSNIFVA